MCLGILNACKVDPVVALRLKKIANYGLPNLGSHGTKLGHAWLQWIMKSDFLAGLTILKKEMCLGILNACGVDPVAALHLRNAADYRLPTFGSHGTKLGHSWLQWIIKSDFLAGLTILKKEMCLGIVSACRVDPVVSLRLKKSADYRLPNFGSTRAFLISMINKKWFSGWFNKSEKEDVYGHCERLQGQSCGFTPP